MQVLTPKLKFVYGPMGSAKTAHLIISAFNFEENGIKPLILTSAIDTRSAPGTVSSRIKALKADAISLDPTSSVFSIAQRAVCHIKDPVRIILIDEAHFLTVAQAEETARIVDSLGIPVTAYGLRADFRTELFPASAKFLALADSIQELPCVCPCGAKAIVNARMSDGVVVKEGSQILVGGNETYISLCRKCYNSEPHPNVPVNH